jgi:hypothetical protein
VRAGFGAVTVTVGSVASVSDCAGATDADVVMAAAASTLHSALRPPKAE